MQNRESVPTPSCATCQANVKCTNWVNSANCRGQHQAADGLMTMTSAAPALGARRGNKDISEESSWPRSSARSPGCFLSALTTGGWEGGRCENWETQSVKRTEGRAGGLARQSLMRSQRGNIAEETLDMDTGTQWLVRSELSMECDGCPPDFSLRC